MGCGNLGSTVVQGIAEKLQDKWKLAGVFDSDAIRAGCVGKKFGCRTADTLEELLEYKPDIVVEATAPDVLRDTAERILKSGCSLMPLSIGAFADTAFCSRVENAAKQAGKQVYFVSGAIGGLDIMQAAMMSGELKARILNIKSPEALSGAPWLEKHPISGSSREMIFRGNAHEAIEAFPKNVNVAVTLALATTGVEHTMVEVECVPGKELNTHTVFLEGDFGRARIEIESKPCPDNPRSSAIAAMSVIARLKNLVSPFCFI